MNPHPLPHPFPPANPSRRIAAASLAACLCILTLHGLHAQDDAPSSGALAQMPVKEVTVFKDGHAFVLHEGMMPVDASGNVSMDYLPSPVLGTFWPFVAGKDARLSAVTASQRRVTVERTPLGIVELIAANPGAAVQITETPASSTQAPLVYPATIIGLTERSSKELEATAPPNSGDMLPQKGSVVLLKTDAGVKAVQVARIQDVTFKEQPKNKSADVEFRNLLTLRVDWGKAKPEPKLDMGLMYLQRGIRWIPGYKITLDGKGNAVVKLQATLLNELTDMEDVTCNLVVGVPTFQFRDTKDPMALQQNLAQLSQYFRDSGAAAGMALSNSIMTQSARMSESQARQLAQAPADLGPELSGTDQVQDLHIYTVKHVTLKKGARMVLTVSEFTVPYSDVYVLDLPFGPPADVWQRFNTEQQADLARLLSTPKVMHRIRMKNTGDSPFTTAPALIVSGNQVLAQGLMTYTSKGASTDLDVTTAVDVRAKNTDNETLRAPNASKWDEKSFFRVDLSGTVSITNYRKEPVELEVVRRVLGNVTKAGQDGTIEKLNVLEDAAGYSPGGPQPLWWRWWSWPNWWSHFNGMSRITWKQTIEPGKSVELNYEWNYYWR